MTVETVDAHESAVAKVARALPRVSVRTALIAGVTALGIAAALPNGPVSTRPEVRTVAAASVAAPLRVSQQDVELTSIWIPGWSDAMNAIATLSNVAEPLVTNTVNFAASVASYVPVVNVVARQVYIVYNYLLWPILWLPTSCGVLFAATLDFGYLEHWISVQALSLADFVQAEANFFLGGGWIPFAAPAATLTSATAGAKPLGGGGSAEVSPAGGDTSLPGAEHASHSKGVSVTAEVPEGSADAVPEAKSAVAASAEPTGALEVGVETPLEQDAAPETGTVAATTPAEEADLADEVAATLKSTDDNDHGTTAAKDSSHSGAASTGKRQAGSSSATAGDDHKAPSTGHRSSRDRAA